MKSLISPQHARIFLGALTLGTALHSTSAEACGGFFCSSSSPVDQTAERIIFAQDDEGNVTQIVEVLYEGPADKFSWVLPVPGTPKPAVSSKQVFDKLQQATAPQYYFEYDSSCSGGDGDDAGVQNGENDVALAAGEGPKVTVLDAGSVGPFNYETISVQAADEDPADVAVTWLEKNGYDVGPTGREVLGPYLANGLNLIAFRLQKGATAGAIRPISLQYKSNAMAIPIRPTAVAAQDDMPVLVWVLGSSRAVTTNYRGLEINELLIDWFNPTASYDAVVTAAANQAGGQGFVTELAEEGARFKDIVAPTETDIENALNTDGELPDVLMNITRQLGSYDGFLDAVRENLTLRSNVTPEEFASCVDCYFYPDTNVSDAGELGFGGAATIEMGISPADPIYQTDLEAFAAAVHEHVMLPLLEAGELFAEHKYVTRLYTTMSDDEMTVDPMFEFNPDLENVSNIHSAKFSEDCEGNWVATLDSGEKVYGTGSIWPYSLGNTELPVNARILQYSTSGLPQVVTDNRGTIQSTHLGSPAGTAPPVVEDQKSKGGCTVSAAPDHEPWSMATLAVLLGAAFLRRRRVVGE